MTVRILADNWLVDYAGTLAVTSAVGAFPATRLHDRNRDRKWMATTNATQTIDIDRGPGNSTVPTAWAVFGQGGVSGSINLQSSPDAAAWETRDSVASPPGDVFRAVTLGSPDRRHWRVRFGTNSAAPEAGEIMMGTVCTLPAPSRLRAEDITEGYVTRDESPSGHPWKHKNGEPRIRLIYGWDHMDVTPDLVNLLIAFAAADEGARNVAVEDAVGVPRLMEWVRARLPHKRTAPSVPSVDVELEFLEVL